LNWDGLNGLTRNPSLRAEIRLLVRERRHRRERDASGITGRRDVAHPLQELRAGHRAGQLELHDHEIELAVLHVVAGRVGVVRAKDFVAGLTEQLLHHPAERLIRLHQQNDGHGRRAC
jgi:hypothetical protein